MSTPWERREGLAEACVVGGVASGGGHVQLEPGDRVVGDPADRIDVRADGGERTRDRGESGGRDGAAEDHHGMGGRRCGRRDVVELDVELHPELVDLLGELAHDGHRVGVLVHPRHDAEGQVAVDDDLLHVDQVGAVGGQDGGHPRGDTGSVGAGDGEEGRCSGGAHGFS